jgi:hypothetical protein
MRLVSTALPALALLVSGGAHAARCTAIDATIATNLLPHCPVDDPSPVGICTVGTVDSGPLAGTTSFVASTFTPTHVVNVFHYTGTLIITTPSRDTLTIRDRGVLDMRKGKYFEFDKVVDGTGVFKGAEGMLTSQGDFDAVTFTFTGSLTGKVCRPGRNRDHDGNNGNDDDADDSADAEDGAGE